MSSRVLGKGRRERTLPLWKLAAAALRSRLAIRGQVAIPAVLVGAAMRRRSGSAPRVGGC